MIFTSGAAADQEHVAVDGGEGVGVWDFLQIKSEESGSSNNAAWAHPPFAWLSWALENIGPRSTAHININII